MMYNNINEWIINCTDRKVNKIMDIFLDEISHINMPKARLQIGSYTCGKYFKALCQYIESKNLLQGKEYDIVIPTFAEHDVEILNELAIKNVINSAKNIVVNDYGMLMYFKGDKRIRLGRLLFKAYRDHRYEGYDKNEDFIVKADTIVDTLESMGYPIRAIEHDIISMGYYMELDNVEIYYHLPYRQISSCHICEFASIGKAIRDKFIPDDACYLQCLDLKIIVDDPQHENQYIKVGRNIFDRVDEEYYELENLKNIIYTPRW